MNYLNNCRAVLFVALLALLGGCEKPDPRATADLFWLAVMSNDWENVLQHSSAASASSVVATNEILPLTELRNTRIQHLKLQQAYDGAEERPSQLGGTLGEYNPDSREYALGDPIFKPGLVTIPTTFFSTWDGQKLSWHVNTRIVNDSGEWKVDFISLKYNMQQQLEAETRDVMMLETRNFTRATQEAIGVSARELAEQFQ